MVSVCTLIGILDDGVQFVPMDKKHYWTAHAQRSSFAVLHRRFVEVRYSTAVKTPMYFLLTSILRELFELPNEDNCLSVSRMPPPSTTVKGLALAKAALDLRIDPFAHGQPYTALSCA